MQHAVVMSGIGGQGIVVGTKLIGVAATNIGRYCLHYAQYGGEMRGTKCECNVTIGDNPITAPPLVSQPDVAIIMHPESFATLAAAIMPGGLGIVNSSLVSPSFLLDPDAFKPRVPSASASGVAIDSSSSGKVELRSDVEWLLVPATDIGKDLGHVMVATMVAISAFAAETGLIEVSDIRSALAEIIPPYRHQLLEMDDAGLRAGYEIVRTDKEITLDRAADGSLDLSRIPAPDASRSVRIPAQGSYIFRKATPVPA